MPCTYSYLQVNFWRSKYNRCTKKSENKVEGSSPSQIFFYFYFLLSQKCGKLISVIYMFAEKKNMFWCIMHM